MALWERFLELTAIPRPSRAEAEARAYVLDWAARHSWPRCPDDVGNILVRVPATLGREAAPVVTLQAHLDMICERNPESPYDPREGRIHVVREGDWLGAQGTTLGADNGIGVALAMAIAGDPAAEHGPLELLFTVCEEQGLEGAKGLDPALVEGRLLVNLDGTSDGAITIGCAGSAHTLVRLPLEQTPCATDGALAVEVSSGRGGHSGGDIHRGRANAIAVLGRLLSRAHEAGPVRLVGLGGGVNRNAIPREAYALVSVEERAEDAIRAAIAHELDLVRDEYRATDPRLAVTIDAASARSAASVADTCHAIDLLLALPSGVVAFADASEGVVETSTSLGVARVEGAALTLASMSRSSSLAGLAEVVASIERIAREHGATVEAERSYEPWEPDPDSPLLVAARGVYKRLFAAEPRLEVVHGGLECAVLGEKLPGAQMISLGPAILGPHAPGERVGISSTQRTYRLLRALLDDLSRPR